MEHGELNELGAALALAQAEIQAARKDATNPHFRSKYADLASIWDACRTPLTKNALSVVQLPGYNVEQGFAFVETVLLHGSGQQLRSILCAPVPQPTPQGVGSTLTYLRRYALAAMVGVAPDDDDGEAATGRVPQQAPRQTATSKDSGASSKQVDFLKKLIQSSVISEDERVQVEDWLETQPSKAKVSKAIEEMKERVEARKASPDTAPVPAGVQREIDALNEGARK